MSASRTVALLSAAKAKSAVKQLPKTVQQRSITTTTTGGVVEQPKPVPLGLLRVCVTMCAGLGVGAGISKNMASFLEENELFVPSDDDDDD